jgi:hypothetical protein
MGPADTATAFPPPSVVVAFVDVVVDTARSPTPGSRRLVRNHPAATFFGFGFGFDCFSLFRFSGSSSGCFAVLRFFLYDIYLSAAAATTNTTATA